MNVGLYNLDLHFQGQTFSCYALAIKNAQTADVPGRFASTRTTPAMELLLSCTAVQIPGSFPGDLTFFIMPRIR